MAKAGAQKAAAKVQQGSAPETRKRKRAILVAPAVLPNQNGEASCKKPRRSPPSKVVQLSALPDNRPIPGGKPPFWADSKPELAQTIPWYNSYQAAAYTAENYVRGVMLDKDEGEGGYIDSEVIIANAGGGRGELAGGGRGQVRDQMLDRGAVAAYGRNLRDHISLGVIVGDRNDLMPVKLPHRYCGLHMFHVTDLWYERSNGYLTAKVKLQKIDLRKKSWWAPSAQAPPEAGATHGSRAVRKICNSCGQDSAQIFSQGWICLNHTCQHFWTLRDLPVDQQKLTYNPAYLAERTGPLDIDPAYAMVPSLPDPDARNGASFSFSEQCQRGVVCPKCQRCNARRDWHVWKCYNTTFRCDFTHQIPRGLLSATAVRGLTGNNFDGPAISGDMCDGNVLMTAKQTGYWRTHTYNFPQPGLIVTHQHACNPINKMAMGSDDLFIDIQAAGIGLRRNAMKSSRVPGMFTDHFTTSYGVRYKYIAPTDVASFADAPECMLHSVRRVEWAAKQAIPIAEYRPFNELMIVGYFQGGHMGYHDDGEKGLGPTVGSLSLGSDCVMTWRMHRKYYTGFCASDNKVYNPNLAVLVGCNNYEERLRLNELAKTVTKEKLNEEARRVLCVKEARKEGPIVLSLKLRHGDMMVMHGALMQEYYEHQASGVAGLRFALTCRWIDPNSVDPNEIWKAKFPQGIMDPENAYDGDIPAYKSARERAECED